MRGDLEGISDEELNSGERIIEVPVQFYAELCGHLKAWERWAPDEGSGIVLWTAPNKRLIFRPKP